VSKASVLILCTGNSCRSQMAEGLINHDLGEQWAAFSAGTEPSGYVHPMAVAAMAEIGIDISDNHSKAVDEFRNARFTSVITVCSDAQEKCPVWLGDGEVVHIGFPDPAQATGSEAERMDVFRQVRDDIRQQVSNHLRAYPDF
jgi:arsenate reductase